MFKYKWKKKAKTHGDKKYGKKKFKIVDANGW